MSENARVSRTNLVLIAVLCAAPVIASYYVFYFAPPQTHSNYGELLAAAPLPDARLQLVDGRTFSLNQLKGKWVLLAIDSGKCEDYCQQKLFTLRQLRLAQGKDMERIERAWLISDGAVPPADVLAHYPGTWLIRAAGSELLARFPAQRAQSDHIYVIDPLGNLMVRFPRDADPSRIIRDLTRLLKVSGIG